MRFKEKVVFVTGGTKGLGKAVAKAFLDEGARVAVNGRGVEAVEKFHEEFKGREAKAFAADILDYPGLEAVASDVVAGWGRVDILVNNAGITGPLAPAEKAQKVGHHVLHCAGIHRRRDERRVGQAAEVRRFPLRKDAGGKDGKGGGTGGYHPFPRL